MTERVNYPGLNEKLVRQIQDMLGHNPKWFGMSTWGETGVEYENDSDNPVAVKIPSATALLEDYKEPNYCETTLCLAGTACLITGLAKWEGYVKGFRKLLRAGRVKADEIQLRLEDKNYHGDFVYAGADALGVPHSTANILFYTSGWPVWVDEMTGGWRKDSYERTGAILLLQALLDDQNIHNPDDAWLVTQRATVTA